MSLCLLAVAGCMPITSSHLITDPDHVVEVDVWEGNYPIERLAVVHGEQAKALVRCMRYETQDNPFYMVISAVGSKPSAFGFVVRDDGTVIPIGFDGTYLFWSAKKNSFSFVYPPFNELYEQLPWQTVSPPATRPTKAPRPTSAKGDS